MLGGIQACLGASSQEILRIIQENHVQLVVMGTQGHGFVGSLFLGLI
ncbi:MAG: universal stress protein [Desulfovermiculus sp.]|nr:universal stress protein [Desulfovermiculus sp.]